MKKKKQKEKKTSPQTYEPLTFSSILRMTYYISLVDNVRQHVRKTRLAENLLDVVLMCSNCALNTQLFRG